MPAKTCKNCQYCDVHTGSDLCKRLKCMATPRGKTLTWTMLCVSADGELVNLYQYFADYLKTHKRPKWCPLTSKNNLNTRDDVDFEEELPHFCDFSYEQDDL